MIAKIEVRRRIALLEQKIKEERQNILAEMDRMKSGCTTLEMLDILLNSKEYLKLSVKLATLNEIAWDMIDLRCDEMFES